MTGIYEGKLSWVTGLYGWSWRETVSVMCLDGYEGGLFWVTGMDGLGRRQENH